RHAAATLDPEERLLNIAGIEKGMTNYAMPYRAQAVRGYDPLIRRRYGMLLSTAAVGREYANRIEDSVLTWGTDPFSEAYLLNLLQFGENSMTHNSPLLDLLRVRSIVKPALPKEYEGLYNFIRLKKWPEQERAFFVPRDIEWAITRPAPMPRFSSVSEYRVMPDEEALLDFL